MQRAAFTMIELIFVIVILGILASIAIPKLTATRDDALVSKELSNAVTTKKNMINEYIAKGIDPADQNTDCFSFSFNNGTLTVTKSVHNGAIYCGNVYDQDITSDILTGQTLGGHKVVF